MQRGLILFCFLTAVFNFTFAGAPPIIKGITKAAATKKPIPGAELRFVEVTKLVGLKALEEKEIKIIKSNKKGDFEFTGRYNTYYRIYCSHPDFLPMFFDVDTRITGGKAEPELTRGIELEVNFFNEEDKKIMALKMLEKFPFDVFRYNSSNETFAHDPTIRSQVKAGTYRDKIWEKEEKKIEAQRKAEEEKRLKAEEEESNNKPFAIAARVYLKGGGTLIMPMATVNLYSENPIANPSAKKISTYVANLFGKIIIKGLKKENVYYAALEGVDESNYKHFRLKAFNDTPISGDEPQLLNSDNTKSSVISFKTDKIFVEQFQTFATGISIGGNLVVGEKERKPLEGVKVILKDAANKVIQVSKTNSLGGFAFTNLDPDEKYLIAVDEADPSLVANKKIMILNRVGQTIYSTTANDKGEFKFEILPTDQVSLKLLEIDDSDLHISFKGRILIDPVVKTPLKNSKLFLFDVNGKPLKTTVTNDKGDFVFENISPDGAYLMCLDESDPSLKTITKVYLENINGQIIKEITKDQLNKFTFKLLPTDYTTLMEMEIEEPWLSILKKNAVGSTIAEPIYFKAGDDHILSEATFVLDKVATIMKSAPKLVLEVGSHTDATGSDAFNLDLSRRRAKAAVDYLVEKGVSANRLKPVGYGETKLKNNCGNNVKCTEAEHAQNRRIEFKILAQ